MDRPYDGPVEQAQMRDIRVDKSAGQTLSSEATSMLSSGLAQKVANCEAAGLSFSNFGDNAEARANRNAMDFLVMGGMLDASRHRGNLSAAFVNSMLDTGGNKVSLDAATGKLLTTDSGGRTIDYDAKLAAEQSSQRNATIVPALFLGSPFATIGMGAAMSMSDNVQAEQHNGEAARIRTQLSGAAGSNAAGSSSAMRAQEVSTSLNAPGDLSNVAKNVRDASNAALNVHDLANGTRGSGIASGDAASAGKNNGARRHEVHNAGEVAKAAGGNGLSGQLNFNPVKGYNSDVSKMSSLLSQEKLKSSTQDMYALPNLAPELFPNQHKIERSNRIREQEKKSARKNESDKVAGAERKRQQMRVKLMTDRSSLTVSNLTKRKEQLESDLEVTRGKVTLAESARMHSELEVLERAITRLTNLGLQ